MIVGSTRNNQAPAFDILNDIGWTHAYWTEGPEFQALGYANNDTVTVFPDEISTKDFEDSADTGPTYVAAYSSTNISGPALTFNGSTQRLRYPTSGTFMTQPDTVVVVGQAVDGNKDIVDGSGSGTRQLLDANSGTWRMFAGTSRTTGHAVDSNGHLFIAYFNAANSYLTLDGSQGTVAASIGTDQMGGTPTMMGTLASLYTNGALIFVGYYSGELSSDDKDAILAWAQSTYGTP